MYSDNPKENIERLQSQKWAHPKQMSKEEYDERIKRGLDKEDN